MWKQQNKVILVYLYADIGNKGENITINDHKSVEDAKKKHPSVIYNKNMIKIEIGNKNKETIEISDTENLEYENAMKNLYKLQSMSSSEEFWKTGMDYKSINTAYIPKSNLPVMHKVVLEFKEDPQVLYNHK